MSDRERVTYRSVLANREFAALFVSQSLSTVGDQLARIAVAVLAYDRGGALAAAATYAVGYLAYLLGGPVLSVVSDQRPRVAVMVVCDLIRAPATLLLCLAGLPLWSYLVIIAVIGLLSPPFDTARSALLPELLDEASYPRGQGLINVSVQLAQVVGFVAGGALVALVSVRGTLAVDAGTFLVSAGLALLFITPRRAALAPEDRAGVWHDARAGIGYVLGTNELRRYLLFSALTSVALISTEGLAVPAAHALGGGSVAAGLLTAAVPAGTVLGGVLVLQLPTTRRLALLPGLSVLCCAPLLLSPFAGRVAEVFALWFVAGLGNCVTLVSVAAYMQACRPDLRGRASGVAATTLQVAQGVALLSAGALSRALGPRQAVSLLAAATLVAVLVLPVLRSADPGIQGNLATGREQLR